MTVLSPPIPAYQNLPIEPQNYAPSRFVITNISMGLVTTITTDIPMNYVIGNQVRLLIPQGYGCMALTGQTGFVVAIPEPTQVVVDINSQFINAFINANYPQQPQIIAIGDINTGQINTLKNNNPTNIPGSFINISPYNGVP